MKNPNLDEITKKELNELTLEEVSPPASYAYGHEILWYGINAVTHTHLMRIVKDVIQGKLSKEEFIDRYDIEFKNKGYGFNVSLKAIEDDGIFIPQQAYLEGIRSEKEYEVPLFTKDYVNRLNYSNWVDKGYAKRLMNREWKPVDFETLRLIEEGDRFGKDMWRTCIEGFDLNKDNKLYELYGINKESMPKQPKKVTRLAESLIEYYSDIVFDKNNSR